MLLPIRVAIALLLAGAPLATLAQAQAAADGQAAPQLIDRVVAVVNGDVILASDVEEEQRYAAFEPFSDASHGRPASEALDRLIDRTLIEQQMKNQPGLPQITDEAVEKELAMVRKDLPACAKYACFTQAGWEKFCAAQGFTPQQVEQHWRNRMLLLAFIEQRFRTGIRVEQAETEKYYQTEFVPRFKERGLTAPPLAQVRPRIEEILLQQRVNRLLSDWLKGLREQGTVQILDPSLAESDTAAPGGSGGSKR